ncbi:MULTISPECIES: alpha-2,8-polysialyltransferase family protein [unclassified Streptomyces]|uniref:alpha-2,8-polysialyltransferase family protein n=1 Tax=unclassified Streptomyces TaxID=2593676 RepID=UPI00214B6892|nr:MULTISPECIES: alpha-2,8-polysialyltransferase family protein [unclassified Streptomyces]MCX5012156.1 alpha-2,8-polysialyltransferase family protein [Streptomyces sp. NBC_00555]MCX5606116.1 alpha-2,8-polysialyltransferase family protein [Streptomyces sp. NBC_00047]UUU40371.1 alpha-2,8-polysialyltransferase family protein [Streptomyces sp. NBC_00162]
MPTQIFLASTLYGAATLAAGIDAGAFPPAARRILLTSNHAVTAEVSPGVADMPGFDALRPRFDEVLDWNRVIEPQHPSTWAPRAEDVPLWERQLRTLWGLGEDRVELIVESIQVAPAQTLCRLFPGAAVDVYADGLMSYGPTRIRLDPQLGMRVRRVLHLDLVPGLEPLLLTEFGVRVELVPTEAFLKVLAELPAQDSALDGIGESPALLLGQYLSALDLMTPEQEEELHVSMVRGAHALGHTELVFKPHPSAPAAYSRRAEEEAERLGARMTVIDTPFLAETLYQRLRPALVVGCFSTGLLTAATLYGLPVARTGTDAILARLTPYPNSNRVPLALVDALLPDLADAEAVRTWTPPTPERVRAEPAGLLTAVGFTMQPQILAARRLMAEAYLTRHLTDRTWRYFTRRRLTALGLPGGIPAQLSFLPRSRAVRRMARRLRRVLS